MNTLHTVLNRRGLMLSGGMLLAAGSATRALAQQNHSASNQENESSEHGAGQLPVAKMEHALGAEGSTRHGVFMVSIGRKDIGNVQGPMGVVFTPDFEIHHDFYFQALNSGGGAMADGEVAVLPKEVDGVVQEILSQGLVFQALHQHFIGENPQVFHIHLRGKDEPVRLATEFRNVVAKTGAPLPQQKPKNPTSELDHHRLAEIIGGDSFIGGGGVVHVMVPRRDAVKLGGVVVNPYLGIMSHIAFKPMNGGKEAAVAPDFSMVANNIDPLMEVMLRHGFHIDCLYNQETDQYPQLFFSHQLNVGDPEKLARAVREGLERTDAKFSSGLAAR